MNRAIARRHIALPAFVNRYIHSDAMQSLYRFSLLLFVNSQSYYNGSYCFGSVNAIKADSYIVFISKHRFNGDNIVNRSREEILADMLSVAIEPVNKTAIMYRAKLSYEQLKDYLSYMVDRQMIETTKEGTWATTEKGKTYLASYQLIVQIIA